MSRRSAHRAPPERSPRVLLAKVLLCLGCLVGVSGVGTLAFWTDTATVPTGSFASGTLDVRVNGADGVTLGDLSMEAMVPGESVAATLTVTSASGTLPLDYYITGQAPGLLAPGLRWAVYAGSAQPSTGSQAQGNRTGNCSTTTALAPAVTLTGADAPLLGSNTAAGRRPVAAGGSDSLCIKVTLDINAGNDLQNKSTGATLTVRATQKGAP